jgi:hypothetical protein
MLEEFYPGDIVILDQVQSRLRRPFLRSKLKIAEQNQTAKAPKPLKAVVGPVGLKPMTKGL